MSGVSDEQRITIEEKRLKALEKLKKRQKTDTQKDVNIKTIQSVLVDKSTEILPKLVEKCSINICLDTVDSLKIEMTPISVHVIALLKTIPRHNYDTKRKLWIFPIENYDILIKVFQNKENFTINSVPKSVVDYIKTKKTNQKDQTIKEDKENSFINEEDLLNLDINDNLGEFLYSTLLPFQKESLKFCINNNGRLLIGDDMGLGKTIQALAFSKFYQKDWPLLIICPSSLVYSWKSEVIKWLKIEESNINVMKNFQPFNIQHDISIISYDSLCKDHIKSNHLKQYKSDYGVIIVDESHMIKNGTTSRSEVVTSIALNCRRIVLLTGTPALSKPVELYSQIRCVCPLLFVDFFQFASRYCDGKKLKFGWNFNGISNYDELKLILNNFIMIRRNKTDVISQLPKKKRELIYLDESLIDYDKISNINTNSLKKKLILEFFNSTALAKFKAIKSYIDDFKKSNEKFIVFAHHKIIIDLLCSCLKDVDYIRIDGSTTSDERNKLCNHFQSHNNCRAAVLSIKTAACGLTLTAASIAIFAELFWNPGILLQAEDRIYRIGQKNDVTIYYLLAKSTVDELLWKMLGKKIGVLEKVGLSGENINLNGTTSLNEQTNTLLSYFEKLQDQDLLKEEIR